MAKINFVMKETTYGYLTVNLPDNYTEEDLENARALAYSDCQYDGEMEVVMISETIEEDN